SINIANFALGRANHGASRPTRVPQGQALALVQIDVPATASATAAIDALRKVEAIASVRLIELGKA
ncbi:MAG: phosphoglycerate dehydrogenase, partial [Edaphobacter sp.]